MPAGSLLTTGCSAGQVSSSAARRRSRRFRLVASIRLHFLDVTLNAQSRGPVNFLCDAGVRKGDELGWFEHGSTIIVLAPEHFEFCGDVREGARVRAGEALLRKP